ncbi:MAG: nucleotide sugar dehydrogenase [Puniceicoccaceae bacterium]
MKKIAIIGMGYVGLPLGIRFAESGVNVIGIDVDASKAEQLNRGESYIRHIDAGHIRPLVESGQFCATDDFSAIAEVEAVIICVPTPLDRHQQPDLSFVLQTGASIAPFLSSGVTPKLVVLESTTYPGTTEEELKPILESGSGLLAGEGFHLAYSPEREDPGRKDHSVKTIPKVMGGYTPECLRRCVELYSIAVEQPFPVSSCRVAEATKLTENIFRSVNIALVNELKVVYDSMGIDVWEVIDAAKTKPFGFMPFYPGPGLGGHCIPIDPFYLTWKAREFDLRTRFIELAGEINTSMPDYVISKVADMLNSTGKPLKGSRILLLGLAYKPNVDDDRESPSYVLIDRLEAKGATVDYHDPQVPVIKPTREHGHLAGRRSVEISDSFDLILLSTHHQEYIDFDFSEYVTPIVDTRSCLRFPPKTYCKA